MSYKNSYRFISHCKTGKNTSKDLSIIILNAGVGKTTRSYGPRCLLKVGESTVLEKQISVLNNAYPHAEIIVVLGFEMFKIYSTLPNLKYAVNSSFEDTTSLYSAVYGLLTQTRQNTMFINGDIVFNLPFINHNLNESFVIADSNNQIKNNKVGLYHHNRHVTRFSYSSPLKWGQVIYLKDNELDLFKKGAICKQRNQIFINEMLNEIIDNGAKFNIVENANGKVVELDAIKDIERAAEI